MYVLLFGWQNQNLQFLILQILQTIISLTEYIYEVARALALILTKTSECVKTFKNKGRGKDENKNNKLVSFHKDDDKLPGKYKTIWTKIEALQNIELNAFPIYDKRYIFCKR